MGDFPIIKNPYGILVGGFNPSEKDSSVGIIFFPYGKINYGPVILEGLEELDDVWVVHHLHDGLRGGSFKGTTTMVSTASIATTATTATLATMATMDLD